MLLIKPQSMLTMSGADALQNSTSKVAQSIFQPAFIVEPLEKKNALRILHVDDDQTGY